MAGGLQIDGGAPDPLVGRPTPGRSAAERREKGRDAIREKPACRRRARTLLLSCPDLTTGAAVLRPAAIDLATGVACSSAILAAAG